MRAPDREAAALDAATQLDGESGTFSARLSDEWEIWGPSGGYLAALTLRAAGFRARIPRPVSYYCHFLSPPEFDRVEIEVEELKRGRRSESLAVRMTQGGRDIMFALVRTAANGPGYTHQEVPAPEVEPPEDSTTIERRAEDGSRLFPFWNNVSCRRPATAAEWLLVDHQSPVAGDGLIGVSGRVWDEERNLLASGGAQLYSVPRP